MHSAPQEGDKWKKLHVITYIVSGLMVQTTDSYRNRDQHWTYGTGRCFTNSCRSNSYRKSHHKFHNDNSGHQTILRHEYYNSVHTGSWNVFAVDFPTAHEPTVLLHNLLSERQLRRPHLQARLRHWSKKTTVQWQIREESTNTKMQTRF